jgi:hypothetical protein
MHAHIDFPNPKVTSAAQNADSWYRYYAGYSATFVEYTLANLAPQAHSVLDPWNGSGTTTVVAAGRRQNAYGFDVNPVTVIVARARLLGSGVRGSINALADDIAGHAKPVRLPEDPLRFWFSVDSSAQLRALEMSVRRLLIDSAESTDAVRPNVDNLSALASFFYTALFRTVRALAAPTSGTNPTWWKRPPAEGTLRIPKRHILDAFRQTATELGRGLHREAFQLPTSVKLAVGDSRDLPLEDSVIGAVVTSPPYCTRMDYGIATRPELAVLRFDDLALSDLRNSMVGTPTITGEDDSDDALGDAAATFLKAVHAHSSAASQGYYTKYFRQYYAAMNASLRELRRVTTGSAPVVMVIQDGYYKDIHNDVPGIVADMGRGHGFALAARQDFHIPRTIGGMNTHSRKYRSTSSATESVVVLT